MKITKTLFSTALLSLAFSAATMADVSSITLANPTKMDGIFHHDGKLIAAAGWDGSAIYEIDTTGAITKLGAVPGGPIDIVSQNENEFLITSYGGNAVYRLDAASQTVNKLVDLPSFGGSIVAQDDGDFLVGSASRIYQVDQSGNVTVLIKDLDRLDNPTGLVQGDDGMIYIGNLDKATVYKLDPTSKEMTLLATLPKNGQFNIGKLVFFKGDLYATHLANQAIYKINTTNGSVSLFSGEPKTSASVDGALLDARYQNPNGMALDAQNGILYIAPAFGATDTIRKISLK